MSSSIRLVERLVTAIAARLARQDPLGGQGQGIFFADVDAVFIDDGQAVGIGVLGEADGGLLPADFVGTGR